MLCFPVRPLKSFSLRTRVALLVGAACVATIALFFFSDSIADIMTSAAGQLSAGGLSSISGELASAVVAAINGTGYAGIFGLMFLESTSLPIPSEVILPFAGYLVSIGKVGFGPTVSIAVGAGVLGALVDYYIGWVLGMRVVSNYSSRFFIGRDQLQRVEALFAKHGGLIIFASRLIPGVRTLASFPAGSAKMSVSRFVVFTAAGCAMFDAALVYAGDYLGTHWSAIKVIGIMEVGATAAVLLLGAFAFMRMQRKSRAT